MLISGNRRKTKLYILVGLRSIDDRLKLVDLSDEMLVDARLSEDRKRKG